MDNINKIAIGVLAAVLFVTSADSAVARDPLRVLLPESTLVLTHLAQPLNSKDVHTGDYFEFVVDRDIIEHGYILIHGGTRGSGQVTESHAAGTHGKSGGLTLTFMFLYASDHQQIPVDHSAEAAAEDRNTLGATALGIVLTGGLGFFFHNFVHGSDTTIPTTAKAYVTIVGNHMITTNGNLDVAPPGSPDAPAAPPPGSGSGSVSPH